MKRLGREAFDRARQFLKTQARPLDRALYEHRFEGGSVESVLAELTRYQNEDGGFGHALEPDMRTPSSSALATGIGLRLLRELDCSSEHPMVRGAVEYLLATHDPETRVWRFVPHDTNEHPHAPWWHDEGGSLARTFDQFVVSPRAQLVAVLVHYNAQGPSALSPPDWLTELTQDTVAAIESQESLGSGGGDDLTCALDLAEVDGLPPDLRERLVQRIRAVVPQVTSVDPQEWSTYCLPPLKVVHSPQSLVADLLADAVQLHLDYTIEHQTAEGTWEPTWTWGELYPEVWPQAKLEWRGEITLEMLTTLRAFGRVEGGNNGRAGQDGWDRE
jgi:hypothetical protein